MLASNSTTDTIRFFLLWVKGVSPAVRPAVIMTDCDKAQIAALQDVYPHSRIFLCTWHVLRAMRSHFATNEFPVLWEKIKTWVKTDKMAEFQQISDEIFSNPLIPQSLVQYLATDWLPMSHLWSRTA
jgi:MULE transposase domain